MKKAGVKPNEVTYNTVINAHAQKGDPEGVSVPPMRMAGAQWGSALFSRHGMLAIAGFRPGGKAGWPNSPVAKALTNFLVFLLSVWLAWWKRTPRTSRLKSGLSLPRERKHTKLHDFDSES